EFFVLTCGPQSTVPMVPAVPREEPVPNVSAVPIVFHHGDTPITPAPSTRFARWDGPGDSELVGRPEPQQRDDLRSYQAKLSRFRNSGNMEKSIPEGRNRKRRHQPV